MTDQEKQPYYLTAEQRRELRERKLMNTRAPWWLWASLGAVLGAAVAAWFLS